MSITTPIPVASNLKVFDIQGLTEQARKLINKGKLPSLLLSKKIQVMPSQKEVNNFI